MPAGADPARLAAIEPRGAHPARKERARAVVALDPDLFVLDEASVAGAGGTVQYDGKN
jgi:hypothetical protein